MCERAELRAEKRVGSADRDGDLEQVASRRDALRSDAVRLEPFRHLGDGHRCGPHERCYLEKRGIKVWARGKNDVDVRTSLTVRCCPYNTWGVWPLRGMAGTHNYV